MKILGLAILIALLYTLGDSSATKFFASEHKIWYWIVLGVLFNGLGVYIFGYIAQHYDMGTISGIALSLNILLNACIGVYFFKNQINIYEALGMCCCIIGISLFIRKGN